MIAYLVLAIIAIFLLILRKSIFYNDKNLRFLIITLVYVYLFILCVFRSISVGVDYRMYFYFFNSPASVLESRYVEKGYIYINELSQHFNNFMFISALECILIFIGILFLFKVLNINVFTGTSFFVLTYMYIIQFNILRSSIANGIVIMGLAFLLNNKIKNKYFCYILFLLAILVATNIHTTSFYALIFLLLIRIKISDKMVLYSFLIFLFTHLIYNIFTIFDKIALWMFPMYVSKYGASYGGEATNSIGKILIYSVIFFFIYVYCKFNDDYSYKTNVILSGELLNIMLYGSGAIFSRLSVFTNIFTVLFSCLFIDNILPSCKYSYLIKNILRISLILYWILMFLIRIYSNSSGIVPYAFGI